MPIPPLDTYYGDEPGNLSHNSFGRNVGHHPCLPLTLRREHWAQGQRGGPDHHEDFFALYMVRGGQGVHRIDGTLYGLSRGDVYLLAPGSTHSYLDYRDLTIDAFYFPLSLLENREIEALRQRDGFWRLFAAGGEAGIGRRLRLSPEVHRSFEAEIENLRLEYGREDATSVWMLRAGFFRLLIGLARHHETNLPPLPLRGETRRHFGRAMEIAEVLRWCEAQNGEMPTPAQLGAMMWLSPSQFRAVWKRETGVAPAIYLRRLRLERARAHLDAGKLTISQIAREVGFCDAAHFSRAFKAVYGDCPRQYRRQ